MKNEQFRQFSLSEGGKLFTPNTPSFRDRKYRSVGNMNIAWVYDTKLSPEDKDSGIGQKLDMLEAHVLTSSLAGNLSRKDIMCVARFVKANLNNGPQHHAGADFLGSGIGGGGYVYGLPDTNLAVKVVTPYHRFTDEFGPTIYPPNPQELLHGANLHEILVRYGSGEIIAPAYYALITPRDVGEGALVWDNKRPVFSEWRLGRKSRIQNIYLVMEKMGPSWVQLGEVLKSNAFSPDEKAWANQAEQRVKTELTQILAEHVPSSSSISHWLQDQEHFFTNLLVDVNARKICILDQCLPYGENDW